MDDTLTMHELERLEAARKLRSIPPEVLEIAWVREAQVEAVIDAVLVVGMASDPAAMAHARHVGEWSARIAGALEYGPDPSFARRVGVLADVDPNALDRIQELRHVASHVREYQAFAIAGAENPRTLALIVTTASEFDHRVAAANARSAASVLRAMLVAADDSARPIVAALAAAFERNTVSALSRRRRGA
ncbi:MAG TPA: hypothetical protein VIK27_09545 [Candidatus Aquilonibacter sp.]